MQVIIPLAGRGTRLRPHTHSKPKPLLKVAGKEILGHLLDKLKKLDVDKVVFITGEMDDQIKKYVKENYNFNYAFIHQKEMLGDGYALSLANKDINQDVLIIFVDTLFETDLSVINKSQADGIVWVKETDTPERFGVVVLKNDKITKIVEKPTEPISNLALIGMYYFKKSETLFEGLKELIDNNIRTKGEFRLADALGVLIGKKLNFEVAEVDVWSDCGKPETLLDTNRHLLENGHHKEIKTKNSVIIEPVYIEDDALIENSIIGPNASIAGNCEIKNSIIKNSIIDQNAVIENSSLTDSLIGDSAVVRDAFRKFNVGDHSELDFS